MARILWRAGGGARRKFLRHGIQRRHERFCTIFRLTIPAAPVFLSAKKGGATLTMTWKATIWETYQMVFKTNLTQVNWNNLGSTVLGTNAVMTTLDTTGPDPQRFYRVILLP